MCFNFFSVRHGESVHDPVILKIYLHIALTIFARFLLLISVKYVRYKQLRIHLRIKLII